VRLGQSPPRKVFSPFSSTPPSPRSSFPAREVPSLSLTILKPLNLPVFYLVRALFPPLTASLPPRPLFFFISAGSIPTSAVTPRGPILNPLTPPPPLGRHPLSFPPPVLPTLLKRTTLVLGPPLPFLFSEILLSSSASELFSFLFSVFEIFSTWNYTRSVLMMQAPFSHYDVPILLTPPSRPAFITPFLALSGS